MESSDYHFVIAYKPFFGTEAQFRCIDDAISDRFVYAFWLFAQFIELVNGK